MKPSMHLLPVFLLVITAAAQGKTLTATPQTIVAVFDAARRDDEVVAIELAPGTYSPEELMLREKTKSGATHQELIIRPAKPGTVVFDGQQRIQEAEPLGGGVYRVPGATLAMWEVDTRTRYVHVADRATVAAAPGTFAIEDDHVLFHTSDGQPPTSHDMGMALRSMGMRITRPNTIVSGIEFRNYLSFVWAAGVHVSASNVTIRDCSTFNARAGFFVHAKIENVTIEGCRAEDVGCAIYAMGTNMQIHRNTFTKRRDSYQIPTYWQDDNGIQCYDPADGGAITGNVVVGFNYGIYCKCRGQWRVEHNTVIDSKAGIYRSGWKHGNIYRYNIVSGTDAPFHNAGTIHGPVVINHNLVWAPRELAQFHAAIAGAAAVGNAGNVMANPRFVNAAANDFRLMPDSPAVALAQDGVPLGAHPAVTDHPDTHPPAVKLTLLGAAARSGASGQEFFLRDPWIGGGRQFVREHLRPGSDVDYVVPSPHISLFIDANDAAGLPSQMRMRFNDDPWGDPTTIDVRPAKLALPRAGVNTLTVRVSDDKGNWSDPAMLRIRVADVAPRIDGDVVVHASERGAVISFRTDQPALATLEYGLDDSFDRVARQPQRIVRNWDVMAGGDNVVEWTEPATLHHIPVFPAATTGDAKGSTFTYRIRVRDAVGRESVSEPKTFTLQGPARTLRVGPAGRDADDAPRFASLQFAVDRALPGDTVVLDPGIYIGETFIGHGGVAGAPIAIRADQPGAAVLDGVRAHDALLRIEAAPYIHVENLELRWTTLRGSAIYAADSPGITVRRCKIWNKHFGMEWSEGYGAFLHRSPGATFEQNLIFREEVGVYLLQSPGATITHNTAVQCLLGGVMFSVGSAVNTTVTNNSLTFNGNDQMYIETLDPSEVDTFRSDYNNFATQLRPSNEGGDMSVKAPHRLLRQDSKAIIAGPLGRYRDLDSWRKAHGQDQHSLFVDPKYVDPIRHDFRLMEDSPNRGAGRDGADIGRTVD